MPGLSLSDLLDPPHQRRRTPPGQLSAESQSTYVANLTVIVTLLLISGMAMLVGLIVSVDQAKKEWLHPQSIAAPSDVDLHVESIIVSDESDYSRSIGSCWTDPHLQFRVAARNDGPNELPPNRGLIELTATSSDWWSGMTTTTSVEPTGSLVADSDGHAMGSVRATVPPELRSKRVTWTVFVSDRDDPSHHHNTRSVVLSPCSH